MKATVSNAAVRVGLLGAMLIALSACGSSVQPRSGVSGPGVTGSGSASIATCNMFDSNNADRIAGKVTTHHLNGVQTLDKVRVRITSIPAMFDASSTVHVKFFRWSADSGGMTNLDQTPVSFVVEKGTSSSQPISNPMTEIDRDDVAALRTSGGVSGSTAQQFFANTVLVVSGVDLSWDALKIVVYNGTSVLSETNFLLPAFASNPNEYAGNHPSVLNSIHPFWNVRGDAISNDAWNTRASQYCF